MDDLSRKDSIFDEALVDLIYNSNLIESAGTSLDLTRRLCQGIFRGDDVDPNIEEQDPSYIQHLEYLAKTQRKADKPSVIRSRKEVIYHANALKFLIGRVVSDNMSWTEELILETHRILYEGVDDDIEAGTYRKDGVAVLYSKPSEKKKASICLRARAVPAYMQEMVEHLNADISRAETTGNLDPYRLAARYHHQFVMIHPFGDGNGRVSRIILNVLLLKYAGHLSIFGSQGTEKEDYLNIVSRAAKIFHKEDMEVEFDNMTLHHEFSDFIVARVEKRSRQDHEG